VSGDGAEEEGELEDDADEGIPIERLSFSIITQETSI
jgi:hypothetical protein